MKVCDAVEEEFGYVEIAVVALADMANITASLDELITARLRLVELIHQDLTENEKQFLLSFKRRKPDWELLGLEGVSELPAIKWKQINLGKMQKDKVQLAFDKLRAVLID